MPDDFEPEPPTKPRNPTPFQRSAQLLTDWKQCSDKHRDTLEKIAARFAALAKKKRRP